MSIERQNASINALISVWKYYVAIQSSVVKRKEELEKAANQIHAFFY
jgi:hypothetical protein